MDPVSLGLLYLVSLFFFLIILYRFSKKKDNKREIKNSDLDEDWITEDIPVISFQNPNGDIRSRESGSEICSNDSSCQMV